VKPSAEFAYHLLEAGPERFAAVRLESERYREKHGGFPYTASPVGARELEVLVQGLRARYVLEVGGGIGYTSLHIASAFGHTGRLDVVEPDPEAARIAEGHMTKAGLADRVRHYTAAAEDVLPGLSGPYDLVILASDPASYTLLYDYAVRLLRTRGTLLVYNLFELAWALAGESPSGRTPEPLAAFAERLAGDERFVAHFPASLERAIAVRVR